QTRAAPRAARRRLGTTRPGRGEGAARLVAHVGPELRVPGGLEQARPYVCVLTDGSGGSGRPRLKRTTPILQAGGARPGRLYGAFPDAAVYDALLGRDVPLFLRLAEAVAAELVAEGITLVVADAPAGYNSV